MTVTLPDGSERPVQIGQALAGQRFVHVSITASDTLHPGFAEWFVAVVAPNLVF